MSLNVELSGPGQIEIVFIMYEQKFDVHSRTHWLRQIYFSIKELMKLFAGNSFYLTPNIRTTYRNSMQAKKYCRNVRDGEREQVRVSVIKNEFSI